MIFPYFLTAQEIFLSISDMGLLDPEFISGLLHPKTMVEYSFDIPVVAEEHELDFPATMEKIDLDISVIPEKVEHEGGNTTWNSAGKTGGAKSRSKSLPNYLSSPSGSCHDICKYGARIVRGKRDRVTSAEGEDLMQNETVAEKKKKSATCLNPSADPETRLPDKLPVMRDIWLRAKNAVASSQQISSPGKHNSGLKRKTIQTKASLLPMPGFLSNKRNSDTKIAKFIGSRPASRLRSPRSRSNYGIGSLLGNPRSGRHTGSGSPLGSLTSGRNTVIESLLGNPRSGRNSGMRSLLVSPKNGGNTGIGSPLGSPRSGRNTGITSLIGSPKSRRNSLISCSLGSPRSRRNSLISSCSPGSPRSRRNSLISTSLGSPRSRRNSLISTSLGSPRSRRNSLISSSLGSPRSGRNTGIRFSLESPRSGGNSGIRSSLEGPKSGGSIGIKSSLGGSRSGENTGIGSGKERATSVMGETKVSAAPSTRRLSNIKTGNSANVKGVCHLKNQSNPRKTEFEHPSTENIPEKILHVIESKAANKTMGATQNSRNAAISLPSFAAKSLTLAKRGIRVTHLAPSPEKKNQRQAQTGLQTSRSPPSVSPLSMNKSLKHTGEVLRRESSASSSGSVSPLSSLSESVLSDETGTLSERSSTETDNPSDIDYESRPRRGGKISPGDEDESPRKLNSRRGLQHENNCPRKLRSNKGTCLCKTNSRQRSIKRTEAVHIDFADEVERVVLAHADVEDNDDIQTSLSDNIEEFESKHLDVEDEKDNKSCLETMVEEAELRPDDAEDEKEKQSFLTNIIEEAVLRHHDVEDKMGNQRLLTTMIEEVVLKHHDVEDKKHNQSFLTNMIEEVVLRHRGAEDEKDNHSFLATMIEEVVLRHHDVEDKRGSQNLFNNMIEETASKLVQDRKSKVKALVGAFESVISLQDTTSMAPTRAN